MTRRIYWGAAIAMLLLAGAAIAAPFFHADQYRERIQTALSTALGRQVTIEGDIRLDLLTGPGFRVSRVTIGDDPKSSAEPFAYVGELRAVPRWWSLWTGRLEFSSLVLDDAHINVARGAVAGAEWNFEPLLRPGLLATFPNIQIRGGRINFKFGGRKNSFYLLETDLDIAPRASDGTDWEMHFAGRPARSDRPAHGFGAVQGQGRWRQPAGGTGTLELDVKLDRSEMGDMVALVYGHDAGVHGLISGQMHAAGPVNALGIEGEVRLAELHGWDQSPPAGGVFTFRVSGSASTPTQHAELFAAPREAAPVTAHLVIDSYLHEPVLALDAHAEGLPVASLPSLLRNFGASVPEGMRISGTATGELHYRNAAGWTGDATARDTTLELKDLAPLHFEQLALHVAGEVARLDPVEIRAGADQIGTVAAEYGLGDGSFAVDLVSQGGPLANLVRRFPVAEVPLLSALEAGNWSGELRYGGTRAGAGLWTGSGTLSDAVARLPALAERLHIEEARVRIDGPSIQLDRMRVSAGMITAEGDYRYVPGVPRPHQFHLMAGEAEVGQMETLFRPALKRKTNLIDLALTLGRDRAPDWMRSLHAEGTLQVGSLLVASSVVEKAKARVQWDGMQIVLPELQGRLGTAQLNGKLTVDARLSAPRYSGTVTTTGMDWQSGKVNGTAAFQTSGSGRDVLGNLKVSGAFEGRGLEVEPLGSIDRATGEYQVTWSGMAPQIAFSKLAVVSDGETWTGSGASQAAGDVVVTLASKGRQMKLAGSFTDAARSWVER